METGTSPDSLQHIVTQLQQSLDSILPALPFQVQCVLRQGEIWILAQHPPDEAVSTKDVFAALQQTVESLSIPAIAPLFSPESVPSRCPVKLYLRSLGQKQPYAAHRFEYTPVTEVVGAEVSPFGDLDEFLVPDLPDSGEVSPAETTGEAPLPESAPTLSASQLDFGNHPTEVAIEPIRLSGSVENPTDTNDGFTAASSKSAAAELQEMPPHAKPFPWLIAGIGVSVLGFAAGAGWMLTRPCMLGACEPLETAQKLAEQSAQVIPKAKSRQDLEPLQKQLSQAIAQLKQVPPWSARHTEAQTALQLYQSQAETLEQVVSAEKRAGDAFQKGQTIPQPGAGWQEVRLLWQEAIAQMEAIPQTDPLYGYAQDRLNIYRAEVADTERRIATEQRAQTLVATAKSTAQTAEARQGIAKSLENWQLVQATWQVAINHLNQVPRSSTSFSEAQQLLSQYQPKVTQARGLVTREQLASKSFNQATQLAGRAQALQQQNQWSQAIATWRTAITAAQKIPPGTVYHEQIQPLLQEYNSALKQAESVMRVRLDVERVCAGPPRICTYMIGQAIRLQFTTSYERALRTAFVVGQSGDYGTLGGAVQHIESLQKALQAIANNSGLVVEVYDADGSELIGSFNPGE